MRVLISTAIVAILSTGCASKVPTTTQDCETKRYVQVWNNEVEDCKMAVLKVEDRKAKQRAERAAYENAMAVCKARGMVPWYKQFGVSHHRRRASDVVCITESEHRSLMQQIWGTY